MNRSKKSPDLIQVSTVFIPRLSEMPFGEENLLETTAFCSFWKGLQQSFRFPDLEIVLANAKEKNALDPFMICFGDSLLTGELLFIIFVIGGSDWKVVYAEKDRLKQELEYMRMQAADLLRTVRFSDASPATVSEIFEYFVREVFPDEN